MRPAGVPALAEKFHTMSITICATCRNLEVEEVGREFEGIVDTEFTVFTCRIFGWKTKEFYLMAPVKNPLEEKNDFLCEFWEEWKPGD